MVVGPLGDVREQAPARAASWSPRDGFAWPYGGFNGYLAGQARAIGFETAASTLPGTWHQGGDLWWLQRQRVSGYTSISGYA